MRLADYTFKNKQHLRSYLIYIIYETYEPRLWDTAVQIAKNRNLNYRQMRNLPIDKQLYAYPITLTRLEQERLRVLAE